MALQVNVRELVCCDEPDQFGSVRAIPDFKVCSLGPWSHACSLRSDLCFDQSIC